MTHPRLRAINPFGPPPGKYIPGSATDIRLTMEAARNRLTNKPCKVVKVGAKNEDLQKLSEG